MTTPRELLESEDALSRDAAVSLVAYAEEDDLVDYKETFHPELDKPWLDLTIDVSAFANTRGGYLVFGIADGAKENVGISQKLAGTLRDANNVLQKINRHLEPHITGLRSKTYRIDGKMVAIILVPQSNGRTHIISKDGKFEHPSGKKQIRIRKGTFYVRQSGGNHLGDSRDLDDLIERRIDQFRASLVDKVAKVVNTPASSDVFILSKDPEDKTGQRFVIEDSPESIPIRGMSFTIAPESAEEELAGWTVLSDGDPSKIPPPKVIWNWYRKRESISLGKVHRLSAFQFSLWSEAPPFYWMIGLKNSDIRKPLLHVIRTRPAGLAMKQTLVVASFLGNSSYNAVLTALGDSVSKLAPAMRAYPTTGPRQAFGTITPGPNQSAAALRTALVKETNEIADLPAKTGRQPGITKRWRAYEIDRTLYAQDDRYK